MPIEDEIKPKEESKEDLKPHIKKAENVPLGPAKIRKQYTYERLLAFRHSPIVKQRPECLSKEFCSEDGTWDPEIWHASFSGKKSRPSSPAGLPELKLTRKPSDAKERIKQEQDGIILSPQRRSFGHGCQIPFAPPSSLAAERPRPKSPLEKDPRDNPEVNGRVIQSRRRVITRPSRESLLEKERERRERERENGGYEERDPKERYQKRGSYDRQNRRRKDDQPEWFLDAPTNQLETIELHGFGEEQEAERIEVNADLRREREAKKKQRPSELDNLVAALDRGGQPAATPTSGKEFDINDFFNFSDPVPIAPPVENEDQGLTQSRFSHFFSTNGQVADGRSSLGSSRRSSLQKDELEFLQDLRGGHSGSESAGSTPIHALINDTPDSTPFTLLEMLQKGSGKDSMDVENDMRKREVQQKLMEGQAKSLAEIEFELQKDSKRRGSTGLVARGGSPAGAVGESDQTAFNNFLASIRPNQPTERRDFRESPIPGSAPRKSSPLSSTGLPSPFSSGPTDHFFDSFKDPVGRLASLQSPDVPLDNDLHFRTLPPELDQQQNRLASPLDKGAFLDLLSASKPAPENTEAGFHQRQSPLMQEQMSSILRQQMAANNHGQMTPQAKQEALANLVKHAVATNPAMVQSVISHGLGHSPGGDLSNKTPQRSMSPQEIFQQAFLHQQQQQQQQQQQATQRGRSPLLTSPLALGGTQSPLTPNAQHPGGITSPLGMVGQHLIPPPPMGVAVPPGAHQPSPIRPRIPSPQELVKHTQNILQHALIKRQLEVQRENFYARERETKNRSPVPVTPTPIQMGQRRGASGGRTPPVTPSTKTLTTAFTPTSVIRKMHESKAEAKAMETKPPGPSEMNQPASDGLPSTPTTPSHIPKAQGYPSGQPVPEGIHTQGGYPSPVRGTDQSISGQQRVGPPAGHSTPQRDSQPNPVSPRQTELGRGDAAQGANDRRVQINQKEIESKNSPNVPPDSKAVTANGDMLGSKNLTNHQPGFGPHSPGTNQQVPPRPDMLNRENNEPVPEQNMANSLVRHPLLGGLQSYPGVAPSSDQLRPMLRMPNPHHQPPLRQQQPSPQMMPGRQQFPMMHPNQRMPMGSPMGMNQAAQQNLIRGMMFQPNMPPQRPTAVNPMALLAMQQMNQRAAMSQMQMPPQSATSPTQGGMTRGMLASQFTSQQVLHHPGAMGMPMVNPRNLHSPAHPQMNQQNRVPLHQHGMSNDITGPMDHQRNFQMFQMSAGLPPSTNTPSAVSPEAGHNPLTKWFGKDLLKQSHAATPPGVPEGLKVLSVEELERQHQQTVS